MASLKIFVKLSFLIIDYIVFPCKGSSQRDVRTVHLDSAFSVQIISFS